MHSYSAAQLVVWRLEQLNVMSVSGPMVPRAQSSVLDYSLRGGVFWGLLVALQTTGLLGSLERAPAFDLDQLSIVEGEQPLPRSVRRRSRLL